MAARLSGADSFIATLPDGLDTFLQRPRVEQCTGPPEGSKTRAGNTFDLCLVRDVAGIRTATTFELSGGQMQRLAVYARIYLRIAGDLRRWARQSEDVHALHCASRPWLRTPTFRRTQCVSGPHGRTRYDLMIVYSHEISVTEISTDLFDRLRSLKGTKTMIFSTHRFGNLTRHADLIL